MIDGTVVINYLVDTNRDYAQVLEERDADGNLLVRYVYGHDLISQTRGGATTYYHYDGSGSTRALTNGSEAVTDTYVYDAFGNLLDKTGVSTNTHLYTGEFFDSNTGFYYLRARYMNPAFGRFVTMDTFAGFQRDPYSLHKYLYAHANPVNLVDPSGQYIDAKSVSIVTGVLGILAGLNITHRIYGDPSKSFLQNAYEQPSKYIAGGLIGGILGYNLGPFIHRILAFLFPTLFAMEQMTQNWEYMAQFGNESQLYDTFFKGMKYIEGANFYTMPTRAKQAFQALPNARFVILRMPKEVYDILMKAAQHVSTGCVQIPYDLLDDYAAQIMIWSGQYIYPTASGWEIFGSHIT